MSKITSEQALIIDNAYHACMNGKATPEQKLIWNLANAINCAKTRVMINDEDKAMKILKEFDYKNVNKEKIMSDMENFDFCNLKDGTTICCETEFQRAALLMELEKRGYQWHGFVNPTELFDEPLKEKMYIILSYPDIAWSPRESSNRKTLNFNDIAIEVKFNDIDSDINSEIKEYLYERYNSEDNEEDLDK